MSHSVDDSVSSSFYCQEDAGDVVSSDAADTSISSDPQSLFPSPSDESTINRLIDLEPHHMPHPDYLQVCRNRSIDLTARQDSINWILKVHAHYHFRPETAFLSVNYFDRFLSTQSLPQTNGWPFQLLSVTCLSLAAKMEEPYVPLLIDLQVFEPRFVFESKTVQKMELWVMTNLNWRLRSVTPFDYLDYFISRVSSSVSRPDLFVRSSDLIRNTVRVIDFLGFAPSIIAAAAVISAAGETVDLPDTSYARVNQEMVRGCHQLMEEYLVDACPSTKHKDRGAEPEAPPSPVGILDAAAAACVSCNTKSQGPLSGSSSGTSEADL